MCADDDELEGFYDYIFICGVFNLQVPGIDDDLKNALVTLFKHCNKGLALNALSSHTPVKDPELHFTSPEDMAARDREPLLPLPSGDRIENDFTLYVYSTLMK
jgi:hypothetical protein